MGSQFSPSHRTSNIMLAHLSLGLSLVVAISADKAPAPVYGAPTPSYAPAPAPSYAPTPAPAYHVPVEKEVPHPYSYQYAVQDDYSGSNFAANEAADGKTVTGSYTVHLPDGRVQTVTYTADHYNGYVADVKYEGTPVYPEVKPYNPPAPKYAPAPAPKYAPAPAPKYAPAPAPAYAPAN